MDETRRTYDYQVWRLFNTSFAYMPIAATLQQRIFCVHGGLSPHLHNLQQIAAIRRPVQTVANPQVPSLSVPGRASPQQDTPLLSDLLWSDPAVDTDVTGFLYRFPNGKRGCSYDFGSDTLVR